VSGGSFPFQSPGRPIQDKDGISGSDHLHLPIVIQVRSGRGRVPASLTPGAIAPTQLPLKDWRAESWDGLYTSLYTAA